MSVHKFRKSVRLHVTSAHDQHDQLALKLTAINKHVKVLIQAPVKLIKAASMLCWDAYYPLR
jgi:hypothetical protein